MAYSILTVCYYDYGDEKLRTHSRILYKGVVKSVREIQDECPPTQDIVKLVDFIRESKKRVSEISSEIAPFQPEDLTVIVGFARSKAEFEELKTSRDLQSKLAS